MGVASIDIEMDEGAELKEIAEAIILMIEFSVGSRKEANELIKMVRQGVKTSKVIK